MKEILFRGKRCDNGDWVQGFYVRADHHWHKKGIHKDLIIVGASANGGWFALYNKYAVKEETIGQYTGLTDRNGKKIFEGDIVDLDGTAYVCRWDECNFEFGLVNEQESFCIAYAPLDLKVIGNIHDNPELQYPRQPEVVEGRPTMFKVRGKNTGEISTVYAVSGGLFLLYHNGKWVFAKMEGYEPVED